MSNCTTDVETSLRLWQRDGGYLRFLGVTAEHKYRSSGGHNAGSTTQTLRVRRTADAIASLARQFPQLIAFVGYDSCSAANMPYMFLRVGRDPSLVKGLFETLGRRTEATTKARSGKQRMRKCRNARRRVKKGTKASPSSRR